MHYLPQVYQSSQWNRLSILRNKQRILAGFQQQALRSEREREAKECDAMDQS